MTPRDLWSEGLRCERCGATATVVLSQSKPDSEAYHDGRDQNVRAEIVPASFTAEISDMGCRFYCVACGTLASHSA